MKYVLLLSLISASCLAMHSQSDSQPANGSSQPQERKKTCAERGAQARKAAQINGLRKARDWTQFLDDRRPAGTEPRGDSPEDLAAMSL